MELENPLIAAVRDEKKFLSSLNSPISIIFILSSNINNLKYYIDKAHSFNKKVFIHFDMLEGVGKDKFGMNFVKKNGADGVISTKTNIILYAKENELLTVQRFFIVDSKSVQTAMETINVSKPDMVEIMPGILPEVIGKFSEKYKNKIIAGGLIVNKQQVMESLKAGAYAVSTSNSSLWYV